MKKTILKKLTFLMLLAGLVMFNGIKAQAQVATTPDVSYKIYALDAATNQPVTSATKKIKLGLIITNNNSDGYFLNSQLESCTFYNKSSNGAWLPVTDSSPLHANMQLGYFGQIASYASVSGIDPFDVIPLTNTSASLAKTLSVSITMIVTYANEKTNTSGTFTKTVSDDIYVPVRGVLIS